MDIERRYVNMELRAADDGRVLEGYAAVFNSKSQDLGGFREFIRPGAFADAIKDSDVRALWNHDSNYPLGRTKNGTLELEEDDTGLLTRTHLPETGYADDLLVSVRRGDVDQMSFAFSVIEDAWERKETGDEHIRELIKVELFDISPVTYPAYEDTSVSARALEKVRELANETSPEAGAGVGEPSDSQARLETAKRKIALARASGDMK